MLDVFASFVDCRSSMNMIIIAKFYRYKHDGDNYVCMELIP